MPHAQTVERTSTETDTREAVRFAVFVSVVAVLFCVTAGLWLSTCGADVDSAACSAPQRIGLAFGAPLILLAGGVWAFARTYQVWQSNGKYWIWQGAGWFLMCLMLVALTMGVPPMVGPVFAA